jgi:predicted Zn-ribbon and HTH transcriptional regulator
MNEIGGFATFIASVLSIIMIIVFFVISSNISKVRKELNHISRLLVEMGEKTNSFNKYVCESCGKEYFRKRINCPYCKEYVKNQPLQKL